MTLSKGNFLKERKSSNDGTWGNPTLENGEKEGTCWVNVMSEVSQKDKDHYNILTHIYGI